MNTCKPDFLVEFFAAGVPQPQGNKTPFGRLDKATGAIKVSLVEGRRPTSRAAFKSWRSACSNAAAAVSPESLLDEPLHVDIVFVMPRPKEHYGTGRNAGELKKWALDEPMITKPDREKLERAVFDALTGVVWIDDSRVVGGTPRKRYVQPGEVPGVHVQIRAACCCGLPLELCPTHGQESQ